MIIDNTIFDVGILGAGMGGSIAAYKMASEYPDAKTIVFDLGRPFGKRRRQLEGWLGCLPNSDGKFYIEDTHHLEAIVGKDSIERNSKYFLNLLGQVSPLDIIEDVGPSKQTKNALAKNNYNLFTSNYIQTIPKEVHLLSKHMVKSFDNPNLKFVFDNEVMVIDKKDGVFQVHTEYHIFKCKKLVLGVGRSGWRWANNIYKHFGLIKENDTARIGIKIEMPGKNMPRGFNKSHCYFEKEYSDVQNLKKAKIGRFNWNGQVIPEDHYDLVITGFRSNEERWKTDNVSFDVIGYLNFKDYGFEQTDRIGKLSLILANDRAIKEKLSSLFAKKSKISIMREYDWLIPCVKDLFEIIPGIGDSSYMHTPTLEPHTSTIQLSNTLETELEGLYCIGESANLPGLMNAALSGSIVIENIMRGL